MNSVLSLNNWHDIPLWSRDAFFYESVRITGRKDNYARLFAPPIKPHELMLIALWLLLGLILGSAFIVLAHTIARSERRFIALGLVIAALIYVGFATVSSAYVPWLILETLGAGFYGALAWLGMRYSPRWLALGWATHLVWDVGLHLVREGSAFTPAWYPVVC